MGPNVEAVAVNTPPLFQAFIGRLTPNNHLFYPVWPFLGLKNMENHEKKR